MLSIELDYVHSEVILEFTGKALSENYSKLITKETIRECFDNINALGICVIDIETMMLEADVVKCDVTRDAKIQDIPQLSNYVRNHIKNYRQYICRKLLNGNLILEKNVFNSRSKKRMTIYDKGQEMKMAENKQFTKNNGLEDTYDGVCRFEINLNSKAQIRKALHAEDTKLSTVLNSETNPILDFLCEAVEQDTTTPPITDKKTYLAMLVIKDCNYDLEEVEAKMRQFSSSRGTSIKKMMEPYRALMARMADADDTKVWNQTLDQLR